MTKKKLDACSIKHIQKELEDNGLMTDPKMEDASTVSKLKALAALMSAVDHRVQGRTFHSATTIILVSLAGILGGCLSWNACELFAITHLKVLKKLDSSIKEIPSHDTLRRFFSIIKPSELEIVYRAWAKQMSEEIKVERNVGDVDRRHGIKHHYALDGKTICGAADADKILKEHAGEITEEYAENVKIHIETIYDTERYIPLAQECISIKKNELDAIPKLLNCTTLGKGDIVTIDAMGTHVNLAQQIHDTGAYYLLEVKDNQRLLKASIKKCMDKIIDTPATALMCSKATDFCHNDHSCEVTRTCYTCLANEYMIEQKKKWPGLSTFGVIKVEKKFKDGTVVNEEHFFITSLPKDPALIMKHKRQHWQIENGLHWHLDVTFNEDGGTKMMNSAQNFSLLTKIALTILKNDKKNIPISQKKMLAGWDEKYLLSLLKAVVKGF